MKHSLAKSISLVSILGLSGCGCTGSVGWDHGMCSDPSSESHVNFSPFHYAVDCTAEAMARGKYDYTVRPFDCIYDKEGACTAAESLPAAERYSVRNPNGLGSKGLLFGSPPCAPGCLQKCPS